MTQAKSMGRMEIKERDHDADIVAGEYMADITSYMQRASR
jgi:hypothetical protein